jgi:hypothetical protein
MARKPKHQTPATGSLVVDMTRPQTFGGVRQAVGTGHLTVSPKSPASTQVIEKRPRRNRTKPTASSVDGGEIIGLPVMTLLQVSEGSERLDTDSVEVDLDDDVGGNVSYFDLQ